LPFEGEALAATPFVAGPVGDEEPGWTRIAAAEEAVEEGRLLKKRDNK
jgi:hypothetical protein